MDRRASLAMTQSDAGAKPREGWDSVACEISDHGSTGSPTVRDDGKGAGVDTSA